MIPVLAVAEKNIKNAVVDESSIPTHLFQTRSLRLCHRLWLKGFGSALLSAVLLWAAQPPLGWKWLSFVALMPLLLWLKKAPQRLSFWVSYCFGLIYFGSSLYWFVHVTIVGAILLNVYLALYFGLWGVVSRAILNLNGRWRSMIGVAAFWGLCEWGRSHLGGGFGWIKLGHAFYNEPLMTQSADVFGVYGLSILIVMTNVVLSMACQSLAFRDSRQHGSHSIGLSQQRFFNKALYIILLFLHVLNIVYGWYQIKSLDRSQDVRLTVGSVQANVDRDSKWQRQRWPILLDDHLRLSESLLSETLDLIVWPETALPGTLWGEDQYFETLEHFVRYHKTSVLTGAVLKEDEKYYNTALLLSTKKNQPQFYKKVHLVPFGEYIPFRRFLPFLEKFIPIADFTPGDQYQLMTWDQDIQLGVLICFEDTVEYVARQAVLSGADILINITNDAWFLDSSASVLHLQAATFRTIENRRPLLRAANTGVSALIDDRGRIQDVLYQSGQGHAVAGVVAGVLSSSGVQSFYNRFGVIPILVLMVLGSFSPFLKKQKKRYHI